MAALRSHPEPVGLPQGRRLEARGRARVPPQALPRLPSTGRNRDATLQPRSALPCPSPQLRQRNFSPGCRLCTGFGRASRSAGGFQQHASHLVPFFSRLFKAAQSHDAKDLSDTLAIHASKRQQF